MSYRDVFRELNGNEIQYVVPRRYDYLPDDTIHDDGDVDLIIESDQYQTAIDLCQSLGFDIEKRPNGRLRVYRNALFKPGKAVRFLIREPKKSMWKIFMGNTTRPGNSRHKNQKLHRTSQLIDLRNNLAYESPMNESRIPVDPAVTEGMLVRRQPNDGFYTPAPADELAHLIPHCVFNKNGTFSSYYTTRSDELLKIVRSDDGQLELFRQLLRKIFYKADQLVFDLVSDSRYSDIREELRKFSDY